MERRFRVQERDAPCKMEASLLCQVPLRKVNASYAAFAASLEEEELDEAAELDEELEAALDEELVLALLEFEALLEEFEALLEEFEALLEFAELLELELALAFEELSELELLAEPESVALLSLEDDSLSAVVEGILDFELGRP